MTIAVGRLYMDLVRPGLTACFVAAVPAILALEYEPTEVQKPLIYSLADSRDATTAGQIHVVTYRTLHSACIPYADPEGAELLALAWLDALPNSVLASREFLNLGAPIEPLIRPADGRVGAKCDISEARLGFKTIGGALCRAIEFYSTVMIKLNIELIRSAL